MSITWQIDNFTAFKDILETRKLFSKCACCIHCLQSLGGSSREWLVGDTTWHRVCCSWPLQQPLPAP